MSELNLVLANFICMLFVLCCFCTQIYFMYSMDAALSFFIFYWLVVTTYCSLRK